MFKSSKDAFERNASSYLAAVGGQLHVVPVCAPYMYIQSGAKPNTCVCARDKISTRVRASLFLFVKNCFDHVCVFRISLNSTCIIVRPAFLRTSFVQSPRAFFDVFRILLRGTGNELDLAAA